MQKSMFTVRHLSLASLFTAFSLYAPMSFAKISSKNFLATNMQKSKARPRNAFPHCTDFSGVWQGRCVDQKGRADEETLTIIQRNCDKLILQYDNDPEVEVLTTYMISGNNFIDEDFIGQVTSKPFWNRDHKQIHITEDISLSSLNHTSDGMAQAVANLYLSEGQLVFNKEIRGWANTVGGGRQEFLQTEECTYNKK